MIPIRAALFKGLPVRGFVESSVARYSGVSSPWNKKDACLREGNACSSYEKKNVANVRKNLSVRESARMISRADVGLARVQVLISDWRPQSANL